MAVTRYAAFTAAIVGDVRSWLLVNVLQYTTSTCTSFGRLNGKVQLDRECEVHFAYPVSWKMILACQARNAFGLHSVCEAPGHIFIVFPFASKHVLPMSPRGCARSHVKRNARRMKIQTHRIFPRHVSPRINCRRISRPARDSDD